MRYVIKHFTGTIHALRPDAILEFLNDDTESDRAKDIIIALCQQVAIHENREQNLLEQLNNDLAILVWRWQDAPQKFKELSGHGGDEDWVAFISQNCWEMEGEDLPAWMDEGTGFAWHDVSIHHIENGVVVIGAHA